MGKKFNGKAQPAQEEEEELSYDPEVVSAEDSRASVDSEEEAMLAADEKAKDKEARRTGKAMQDRESNKNKLRLGQFHRNAPVSKPKRKVTVKKQIRDIERLLDREGLPEEVRNAKKEQLKELKKDYKKQREASIFELKYKKIKFTEKRKVIRKIEQVKINLKSDSIGKDERSAHQAELKQL